MIGLGAHQHAARHRSSQVSVNHDDTLYGSFGHVSQDLSDTQKVTGALML